MTLLGVFLTFGVSLTGPARDTDPGPAHEIAAVAATAALPDPLHAFFESHSKRLVEQTQARTLMAARSEHFVLLDAARRSESAEDRHSAVKDFPHEREKAEALFKSAKVADGGKLPWTIGDGFTRLAQAFRSGKTDDTIAAAGALIHFSVDAAMPTNVRARGIDSSSELQLRLQDRLRFEVRVAPQRCQSERNAVEAAFAALIETYAAGDALAEIETSVAAETNVAGAEKEPSKRRAYWDKLTERAAPILEARVEAGALLAANLIVGAWTEAGKPELKIAAPSAQPAPASAPQVKGAFVGSSNSTVYHRADCAHAARIKPENRVTFENAEKVKAAGRTPCKTCKPEAP